MTSKRRKMRTVYGTDGSSREVPEGARAGRCFELAVLKVAAVPGSILVHGTIQGMGYPPNHHAWVEIEDGVWEPVTDHIFPRFAWAGFTNATELCRHTRDELAELINEFEHYGPWPGCVEPEGGGLRAT
jgi:hypothetical protein